MQTTTERPAPRRRQKLVPAGVPFSELSPGQQKAVRSLQKLREQMAAEIERMIDFLDSTDGYTMHEREEAVDDVPCDGRELEFSFCGVTADKCSMPHREDDDELEADYGNGQEADEEYSLGWTTTGHTDGLQGDFEDEHDGSEPGVDNKPSLGWTRSGAHGDTLDREIGEATL